MRWGPAFLAPLALISSQCLPPKLELGPADGAAGRSGSASSEAGPSIDDAGPIDGFDEGGGAAGAGGSGQGGVDGAAGQGGAGKGGAAGNTGAAGKSGASGSGGASDGAAGSGNAAGVGGASGRSGASGSGGVGGNSGAADGGFPDATAGNAGSGSGGRDAASDGPTYPSCYLEYPLPNILFCDNFEDPALPRWNSYHNPEAAIDGETRHDTTVRHRGNGALYSRKDGVGDGTPRYVDVLGDRTSGHLYLRTWLYLQSPLPSAIPAGSAASLLVLGESTYPYEGVSLTLAQQGLSLTIRGEWQDHVPKPTYVMPSNQWLCLQVDFEIGATAVPTIRIDGLDLMPVICPVHDAGTCNMLMRTSYGRLWMGINWTNYDPAAGMPSVVFYDDVVVSTEDIGCD